jgi:hypothetical protein
LFAAVARGSRKVRGLPARSLFAMPSTDRLLFVVATAVAALVIGCGPSVSGGDDDDTADARIDAAGIDARGSDGGIDGSTELPSRVYAHSGQMLYRVNTTSLSVVSIGAFTNLGTQSMTDIAVDRDERMIGVTLNKIFEIDETTAAATLLATLTGGDNLTSLSFVPANAADPDGAEMLIAATSTGSVLRIDIAGTAATTTVIGDYGQHQAMDIVSSGDIVYVKGFGTVATVDVGAVGGQDYLATLDPANGWAATVIGTGTGFDKLFGIAFWGGTLYGFADGGAGAGSFVRLDRTTGVGTLIEAGTIRWFGAGVTTIAPIIN